jgi:hypothetical protein
MKILRLLVLSTLFIGVSKSWGQVVTLGTINTAYTQNFDSLERSAATATFMPYGWKFNESGSSGNTTYSPGTGSANGGNTYSLGLLNNSDRALGGLQSGSVNPSWGAIFKNSTGSNITSIDVAYKAETWRVGANNRKDSITFQYNLTGTDITTGTWVTVTALGYANPGRTANSGGLVSDSANISYTIPSLNITNGTTFAIRFLDYDATGADDAIGVDNFSFTPKSASTNTITLGSVSPASLCPGASISVSFTSTGTFSTNTFTAQISNSSGSFASPQSLGTLTSNANTGTSISGTVPTGLTAGSGYKVRVISSNPGATSDTGAITIKATPTFSPATPSFCPNGASASLTVSDATGGSFGAPSGSATGVSVTGSDPNYTVAPGASVGTRTYTYTASNGCAADLVVTVTNPPSAPTFTSATATRNLATVCDNSTGLTYQVTSVASTTWNWQLPSGWTYTGGTGNTITITAIGIAGNITVSATSGGCTSSNASLTVAVNTAPASAGTISGPSSVCASSTGNVYSVVNVPGVTYAWSVSGSGWTIVASTNSVTVTAGASASGTVNVTPSANGCSATASTKSGITVIAASTQPQVRISASSNNICAGVSYTFTATPTDGGSNPSYQWKVNGANVGTGATYTGALNSGDYISCTITNNDCGGFTAVSNLLFAKRLSYNPTLAWQETFGTGTSTSVTTYTGFSYFDKSQFTASPGSSVVDLRTTTVSPSGGTNMFITGIGSSPSGTRTLTISGINTQGVYPNKLAFEFYKTGSISVDSSNFLVEVSPDGTNFYPMPYTAFGAFTGRWDSIVFDDGLPRAVNVSLRFTSDISGSAPPRIDNIRLYKYDTTAVKIDTSGVTTFCAGGSVTLTANPVLGSFSYAWTGGSTSSSISASLSNTYTLTVTDAFGCTASASKTIVSLTLVTYYKDADNDGYSDGTTQISCLGAPANYKLASALTATSGDCNDNDASMHATFTFYADTDGDGYGAGGGVQLCAVDASTPPAGYATNNTDCAANDITKWRSQSLYIDIDGDGYTAGTSTVCYGTSIPAGYATSTLGTDCNDNNAAINPGATEICGNGIDEDCNGSDGVCTGVTWTGALSTDWNTAGNWSSNSVPDNCATDITIPGSLSRYPEISSSSTFGVGDITIANGASITINSSAVLNVCGNVSSGGGSGSVVTGSGRLVLNGTSQQTIAGKLNINTLRLHNSTGAMLGVSSSVSVNTALELRQGQLSTTNGTLTLTSADENQSAVLDNFSSTFTGTISGDIAAERAYVNALNTYTQHYFSSPVNSVAISQFAPASGADGVSITPTGDCDETKLPAGSNYGNVFEYHEEDVTSCYLQAWKVRSAGTATNARGYSVVKSGNGTLTLTGAPNLATSYTRTGLTNSGWSLPSKQTTAGSLPDYQSGWHMVGNPYSALLDPGSASNDSFDNTALVLHTHGGFAGTYQPLSLGSTATLAPFQAFFVRKSAAGGTATFTINATDRRVGQTAFYKLEERQMSITVGAGGRNDITYVSFNPDATSGYDPVYDGLKFTSGGGAPTLFTNINDNIASVNTHPDVISTPTIPMGFIAGKDTSYTLKADGIENLPAGTEVVLEDKMTGVFQQLNTNPAYSFASATTDNRNRFILHFSQEEAPTGIGNISKAPVSIFSNGDKVFVDLSKVNGAGAKVTIYNLLGEVLSNETTNAHLYSKSFNHVETICLIVAVKTADGFTNKKVILTGK